ncbi:hypothetical protein G6W49_13350 [Streptomyces sp. CAI-68]|nr:hypothetical protein [Streptomyces sp. CAI-68]
MPLFGPAAALLLTQRALPGYLDFVTGMPADGVGNLLALCIERAVPPGEVTDAPDSLSGLEQSLRPAPGRLPVPPAGSPGEFREAVRAFMARDQLWARQGNL